MSDPFFGDDNTWHGVSAIRGRLERRAPELRWQVKLVRSIPGGTKTMDGPEYIEHPKFDYVELAGADGVQISFSNEAIKEAVGYYHPVGFLSVRLIGNGVGLSQSLHIDTIRGINLRGKGYSKLMWEGMRDILMYGGIDTVIAFVLQSNEIQQKRLPSLGWEKLGPIDHYRDIWRFHRHAIS